MKLASETTRKIAVFRALQLGDMLCAVPALRALRTAYPDAHITLLGLPWGKSFTERFSAYLDDFIHFPGYTGLPEQPFDESTWRIFAEKIRAERYDLILQMQGNGSIVNEMLQSITDGPVAGFHSAGNYVDSDLFIDYPEGIPEIFRHLKMLENLGIQPQGTGLEFPYQEGKLGRAGFSVSQGAYVCVHPGSRGTWRQWPPAHFAALADICAELGYRIVVTGTEAEAAITGSVIDLIQNPVIDLTGKTDMDQIGELIANAALLISNCTGVSHIAAATETPSIVISMDGEPERWGPLNKFLHRTIDWTQTQDFELIASELLQLLKPLPTSIHQLKSITL